MKAWKASRAVTNYKDNGRLETGTPGAEPSPWKVFPLKALLILKRAATKLGRGEAQATKSGPRLRVRVAWKEPGLKGTEGLILCANPTYY